MFLKIPVLEVLENLCKNIHDDVVEANLNVKSAGVLKNRIHHRYFASNIPEYHDTFFYKKSTFLPEPQLC